MNKKRGRPQVNNPKNERVVVACSSQDKIKIIKAAEKSGASVAGFILNCVKQFI